MQEGGLSRPLEIFLGVCSGAFFFLGGREGALAAVGGAELSEEDEGEKIEKIRGEEAGERGEFLESLEESREKPRAKRKWHFGGCCSTRMFLRVFIGLEGQV